MAKKKKNSNYVTEKTIAKKNQIAHEKKMAKIRRIVLISVISVLIAACVIVGCVLIIQGINKWDAERIAAENAANQNNNNNNNHDHDFGADDPTTESKVNNDLEATHHATITVANYGTIHLELYGNEAPETVAHFVKLVNEGFYNGKTLHSFVNNKYLQGGTTYKDSEGNEVTIKGEFSENGFEGNDVEHVRGVITMYHAKDKNDGASGQFTIIQGTSDSISEQYDGKYAAFGMITSGMNILDELAAHASSTTKATITSIEMRGSDTPSNDEGNVNKDLKVTHKATIEFKDYGKVELALFGEEAPETVAHFVKLVNEGFYDGKTLHRIIEGFMAQGGCPNGDGTGDYKDADKNKVTIKGEFSENDFKTNDVKHIRGVISMARGDDKNSASCQFFIVHKTSESNTKSLDGKYAGFGMVISGMNVIDEICENVRPTGTNGAVSASSGKQPTIKSITITVVDDSVSE